LLSRLEPGERAPMENKGFSPMLVIRDSTARVRVPAVT